MKEIEAITQISDKLLAVPVPQDAERFSFGFGSNDRIYYYPKNSTGIFDHRHIVLPAGTYSILGLCSPKEIGFDCEPYLEKIAFPNRPTYYKSYGDTDSIATTDKLASFRSLLQSKGLDSGHYLILEKI